MVLFEAWCGPCRQQAKDLSDFYTFAKERDVEIVGLSAETSPKEKRALEYVIRRQGYAFKFGWVDRSVFDAFTAYSNFNAIPQVYLISEGKIVGQFQGAGFRKMAELRIAIFDTWLIN